MKGQRVKKLLALAVSFAMLVGNVGTTGVAKAAELNNLSNSEKEIIWEAVEDASIASDNVLASSEMKEVEETNDTYAEDDQVRVFIVFDGDSVVDSGYSTTEISENVKAVDLSEKIEEQQEELINDIEKEALDGDTLETRYSFSLLTNAISAEVKYGQIADIEAVDGVSGVYIVPVYEIQDVADTNTITSGDMVGSYNTWKSGYTGAGMRIAVIDTGIDADHPSFTGDAFMHSLEETALSQNKKISDYNLLDADFVAENIELLNASKMYEGLTAADTYLSEKIPFAFNYVDENIDPTHDNDSQGDHGTHVAGIALANKYVPAQDGSFTTQEAGVVGVAPDAQLIVMKVFGAAGGAYSDDYMAAIEDALVLGADVINMSLGSASAGETASSEEYVNTIFEKLTSTDTIVSISAGNSGFWAEKSQYGANLTTDVSADTAGSPGSYTNAFTVASAVNSGYTGNAVEFDGSFLSFYSDGSSAKNAPLTSLDATGKGTSYDYVLIPSVGAPEDYDGIDVTGKIAIVSRGTITFSEKHMNAENAGAVALIVYNNTTGTIGMNLADSTATIPCASILQADALAAMESATFDEEKGIYLGKLTVSKSVRTNYNAADGYQMSAFSSWGVPGDLSLKPEITAPGGNIYSTLDKGEYGNMSGTSMAAPSISGMSALMLQYIKENNLEKVTGLNARALGQAILMSTATPLVQKDGNLYSPRKQGSGLANIEFATKTPAYILVGDREGNDGKVKVEFGDDPDRTGKYGFNFTVYNMTDAPVYYKLDSKLLTESVLKDYFIANSSYELESKVKYTSKNEVLLYDLNNDKKINLYDVQTLLKFVNHSVKLEKVETCYDDFDFNNDGVVNTCDVRLFAANVLSKELRTVDLQSKVLFVGDKSEVSAEIVLSDNDKKYIDENFENGMYVEGYALLNGKIDLSIPMLGFYGNWTESSMFEPFDYFEYAVYGETWPTYSGIEKTNYITYKFNGDSKNYYYASNMYADDNEYLPERNAISSLSGDSIGNFVFSLIRNAADIKITVTDAETNEEYVSVDGGSALGEFYSSSQTRWANTSMSAPLNWNVTDAEGNPLPEGTKVNITVTALPAYYNDGKHTPAEGTQITVPMIVDNTSPSAELKSVEDGKMTIEVTDNEYVAAVYIFAADQETLIDSYAVNQTEKASKTEVTFEYPETVFYVTTIDYAGNLAAYRVNKSGIEDTEIAESIELSETNIKILKGSSQRVKANVGPISIIDTSVVWTSENEDVATVNENGIVTGVSEGTTTITATTVAVDENGEHLSASLEVEVFALSADVNAIVWNEEGEVSFAKFNTKNLPEYEDLSEKQNLRFWSSAMVGDRLLASTYSDSETESEYYWVDTNDYSAELITTGTWSTDMAYGEASEKVYGTYGSLVNVIDPEEGVILGSMSLKRYTDGANLVGIAYITSQYFEQYSSWCDWFYLVDENGELYQLGYLYGLGFFMYDLGNTGISTNGLDCYNSITYDADEDFIYWSCYDDGNNVVLYAINDTYDEDDKDVISVYELGRFADKVWPVSGLYQYTPADSDAIEIEGRDVSEEALNRVELETEVAVIGLRTVKKEVVEAEEETEEAEELTEEEAVESTTEEAIEETEEAIESTTEEAIVEESTEESEEETTKEALEEEETEEATVESESLEEATIEDQE